MWFGEGGGVEEEGDGGWGLNIKDLHSNNDRGTPEDKFCFDSFIFYIIILFKRVGEEKPSYNSRTPNKRKRSRSKLE